MRAHVSLIVLFTGGLSGCSTTESVRYVYQDKSFGVIGMPENTDRWPSHYHRKAEKLMKEHFPDGHEIIRAEEVTEGSRTLKIEGSKTAEINPQVPAEILKIAKLGRTSSRSQADTVKIKECRIIYRRASHTQDDAFAFDVDVNPTRYVDPNDAERKKPETAKNVTVAKSSNSKEG
jgi:ethanolamine utilization protein EutA (predicted chaperonin)